MSNSLLLSIPIEDDFNLIERREREENDRTFKSIISEEKGSYPGQCEAAHEIAKRLIRNFHNGVPSIYSDGKTEYRLVSDYASYAPCKGSSFNDVVTITVNPALFYSKYDIESTVAHEIMHGFQCSLDKIDGVNRRSMFLYYYLLEFAHSTTLRFSSDFFYALYYVFPIERKANVSSISSFLREYFANRHPTSAKDIQEVLKKCDKYREYVFF